MSGAVARRANTQAERHHSWELDEIARRVEAAEVKAAGIARVTQRAILEAMTVNLVRGHAQQVDPDGEQAYAFLAALGVAQLAKVIQGM
ncbi:hypothetical protein ACIBEJ_10260 [Nonomuraea sp. NPDC050790]|uniref:hypothetical protein n=1 Tax=Nonomuraea sp. NPDC050790 TaxID=3364371 RepID=UPI0037B8D0B5